MAYCLAVGMPENHVLHRCDVPLCCNPSHLYDGTPLQNMTDKHLRGRGRYLCGEEHRQAKLTWERVRAIRADPRPASALAVEHGVHKLYIRKIRRGEIWKES